MIQSWLITGFLSKLVLIFHPSFFSEISEAANICRHFLIVFGPKLTSKFDLKFGDSFNMRWVCQNADLPIATYVPHFTVISSRNWNPQVLESKFANSGLLYLKNTVHEPEFSNSDTQNMQIIEFSSSCVIKCERWHAVTASTKRFDI